MPDIGACSLAADDIDDYLLEDFNGEELLENPRKKAVWKMEWPVEYYQAKDRKTGKVRTIARRPAGTISDATFDGLKSRIKVNPELGMLTIDRKWGTTCKWRTKFCDKHCYNRGLIDIHPSIKKSGKPDEEFWAGLDGKWLVEFLHSDTFDNWSEKMGYSAAFMRGRIRLATRGETFADLSDVDKVADLLDMNPQTLFWIPTRAWRAEFVNGNEEMINAIEQTVMVFPNARVLASTDPTNTPDEIALLDQRLWSTMFFGDDYATDGRFKCPKTHKKWKSYCRLCKNGCFSASEVHVHLSEH